MHALINYERMEMTTDRKGTLSCKKLTKQVASFGNSRYFLKYWLNAFIPSTFDTVRFCQRRCFSGKLQSRKNPLPL
jgi:hypothetical protein